MNRLLPRCGDLRAFPKLSDGLDAVIRAIDAIFEVLGSKHEIIWMPTDSNGHVHTPLREVVDHTPILGYPNRAVERQHHASGTYSYL